MTNHRLFQLALLVALCLMLSGCTTDGIPVTPSVPELTLPPASVDFVAPIGDAALEYSDNATLYLPRYDGTRLVGVTSQVVFSASRPHAESVIRALLNYVGDGAVNTLGGGVRLSLYGVNPVEVSRDVATVNLSASALQLDRSQLYMVCQAIANTLTELPEINYVNVLVVDKPIGLDIANTLPMGTLSRSVGQDVNAVYEQLLTRRVGANESAAEKSLSSNVTLYFPISGTSGVMSEVRTCSFSSQVFSDMVMIILRSLAAGPTQNIASPPLPLLPDLLNSPPGLTYFEEVGGQVVTLTFDYNLDDMLDACGLTRAQSMASLCYTLCTYFPSIAGIHVTIGDAPVGTLMLTDDFQSSVTFSQNIQQRADFAPVLYDQCVLYFADADGQELVRTERPLPYYQRRMPRALLVELAKGPQSYDSVQDLSAVMPQNAIADSDVLGLSIADHTMLINLAPAFFSAVEQEANGQRERLLAYAMVNTLCCDERVKSLCFFLSGSQFDGFSGEIYWRGLFHPML